MPHWRSGECPESHLVNRPLKTLVVFLIGIKSKPAPLGAGFFYCRNRNGYLSHQSTCIAGKSGENVTLKNLHRGICSWLGRDITKGDRQGKSRLVIGIEPVWRATRTPYCIAGAEFAGQDILVDQAPGTDHRLPALIGSLIGTPAQRIFQAVEALATRKLHDQHARRVPVIIGGTARAAQKQNRIDLLPTYALLSPQVDERQINLRDHFGQGPTLFSQCTQFKQRQMNGRFHGLGQWHGLKITPDIFQALIQTIAAPTRRNARFGMLARFFYDLCQIGRRWLKGKDCAAS